MTKQFSEKDAKSKIISIFSKAPQTTLGIEKILSLNHDEGRALVLYNAGQHMCHSGNIVQGGFITGWLDASMALACMAKAGADVLVLSLEIKTSFINVTTIGKVYAEGWVYKIGKNIGFLEGELKNEDGKILAKGSQTVKLKPNFYK